MENYNEATAGSTQSGRAVERVGAFILRYGLALILLWIGCIKFTSYEAMGIKPLVAHSPLMSWMYVIFSVQGVAIVVGVIEIILAILIALYPIAPRISAVGSWGAVIMGIITLTFLFSTPGVVHKGYSFPALGVIPGQFLIKDLLLLGAAVFTAGESQRAMRRL